jgi:hypothetical protein
VSDPSDVLGVAEDATLPEIKRAYARALKANRPDDDPDAFGVVQAAYEACVDRVKRREAGIEDLPDWFDDEDGEWRFEVQPAAPAVALSPDIRDASVDAHDEATGDVDAVAQAVADILRAAAEMPIAELGEWLRADERFYDLAFKHDVGDSVIGHASQVADDLSWQALAAIHDFFEVDSVSDPRLRRDFIAREVWLRVEGDARFARRVKARRSPHVDFADRIVLAELFDPPDRRRHLKMHLIPTLAGQLRSRFQELSVDDPERAEAAISAQAREYWLPLTDPTKLAWRRVALVLGQSIAYPSVFALFLALIRVPTQFVLSTWGLLTGVAFGIWLFRALWSLGWARYSAWRLGIVGGGETPVGANVLTDRITVIAGSAAIGSLGLSVLSLRSGNASTGAILQIWLAMAMLLVFRCSRFRWDALLAAAAAACALYLPLRSFGAEGLEQAFMTVVPGAFASGVLTVVILDILHSRVSRLSLADIRDAVSAPQCVLAVVSTAVAWFTR